MNGRSQMQGGKIGFCEKRLMQTGSSETLTGWKSGETTFVPLRTEWRESGYGLCGFLKANNYYTPESRATLPPFGPIEGHKWFF